MEPWNKVNFKYLLFNHGTMEQSFENCSYLSRFLLPQRWRHRGMLSNVALNQTLLLQKYRRTSRDIFYGPED